MNERERPDSESDGVYDVADVVETAGSGQPGEGSGRHAARDPVQDEPEATAAGQVEDTAAEVGTTAGTPDMTGETPTAGRETEEGAAEARPAAAGAAGMTGLETPSVKREAEEAAAEVSGVAAAAVPFSEAEATVGRGAAEASGAAAGAAPLGEGEAAAAAAAQQAEPRTAVGRTAEYQTEQAEPAVEESVQNAAERAELAEANAASAAELGAAGLPESMAHPGRTLLDTVRDKPILAAAPAAVLAFILWRAVRGR
ncbi:hypothetical protein [Nocardia amamiensis]|uniref:hypothetical protein n=1 Tax=Nocardia TaxID=1817 RepID=UPI0033EEA74C